MRNEFIKKLLELASNDRDLILITGDLGFGVLDEFARNFPDQFVNAGVAEQNMVGVAVGLALEGKTVFTYSIGNFSTVRCLEQIRNDVCYHEANVKIVAVGGGFAYGPLGMTHHATEDMSIMRSLPNLTVIAPGDPTEAAKATEAIYKKPGPCYLRLGRGGEKRIHNENKNYTIGEAIQVLPGDTAAIISSGGTLDIAYQAGMKLNKMGISTAIYSMHSIKPLDVALVDDLTNRVKVVITVEENNILGGLGGAVAEVMAEKKNRNSVLKRIGLRDCFASIVGTQEHLRKMYGISDDHIMELILATLNGEI